MKGQRISAGGIVVADGKLLLVHHYRENEFDFWVLPGGGLEGDEGIFRAAEREVLEETSLQVHAERIAYIEEFIDEGRYVCKFWVSCRPDQGEPSPEYKVAGEEFLNDARFFSAEELRGLNVYPEIVRNDLWQDLAHGFPAIKYLGYR